jgi:hypothetical protein
MTDAVISAPVGSLVPEEEPFWISFSSLAKVSIACVSWIDTTATALMEST